MDLGHPSRYGCAISNVFSGSTQRVSWQLLYARVPRRAMVAELVVYRRIISAEERAAA